MVTDLTCGSGLLNIELPTAKQLWGYQEVAASVRFSR